MTGRPTANPATRPREPETTRLADWARTELLGIGINVRSSTTVRATAYSSVERLLCADGRTVYAKENPPRFADEARILAWVASVDPTLVPEVLLGDGKRRLICEDASESEPDRPSAVERLSELQLLLSNSHLELPEFLLRLGRTGTIANSFRHWLQSPVARSILGDPLIERTERSSWAAGLDLYEQKLADCGIRDSIEHGDLNYGNLVGRRIVDWPEASVAHPLWSIFDLCASCRRYGDEPVAAEIALAWNRPWIREGKAEAVSRALEILPTLAPARTALLFDRVYGAAPWTEQHSRRLAEAIESAISSTAP